MSRYIDADKLKTIESIQSADFNSIESIRRWIDEQQTADVVKVVRCKDCKHCEKRRTANYQPFFYCLMQECSIKDDDYCSFGERKDNE